MLNSKTNVVIGPSFRLSSPTIPKGRQAASWAKQLAQCPRTAARGFGENNVDSIMGHRKTDRCVGVRTPAVRPGAGVRAGWTGWAAPKKSVRAPTAHVVENRLGGHRPCFSLPRHRESWN